jgi:hypothetical protein
MWLVWHSWPPPNVGVWGSKRRLEAFRNNDEGLIKTRSRHSFGTTQLSIFSSSYLMRNKWLSQAWRKKITTYVTKGLEKYNWISVVSFFLYILHWIRDKVWKGTEGASLNTLIERGSDARLGGVHFSGPPRFGPLEFFLVFFAKFGFCGPNYFRKPPMRSSKAPPKQKNRGRVYPTPATPSRTWPPSHARWGFLGTSGLKHWSINLSCVKWGQ